MEAENEDEKTFFYKLKNIPQIRVKDHNKNLFFDKPLSHDHGNSIFSKYIRLWMADFPI